MLEARPIVGAPFDDPTTELPGVPLDKLVAAAARRNGGYAAYKTRDVASALRNRKLLSQLNRPSPAGKQACLELDAWLDVSRGPWRNWAHDQTWLRAFLTGAGAAVLLAEIDNPGHKVLQQIGEVLVSKPPTDLRYAVAFDGPDMGRPRLRRDRRQPGRRLGRRVCRLGRRVLRRWRGDGGGG